ncbi:hypothetical protein ACOSQ4_024651 [Xanthoceras sorbifolium]
MKRQIKRRRLISANTKRKHKPPSNDTQSDDIPEYCVSRLPEDIIVNIFSRLTLREAARTSVVSTRWRYLWTYTSNLAFDAPNKLWRIGRNNSKRSKYWTWVNKVLEMHRGPHMNVFKIHFDLDSGEQTYMTNWINTAFAKGVQKLELNLCGFIGYQPWEFRFPVECYNNLKTSVRSLRSLILRNVDVPIELIELLIHNCPHLERLSVAYSSRLSSFKIVDSSIPLKYLDINSCDSLKEIEIMVPSLLSFRYYGQPIKLQLENVPLLRDVFIGGCDDVQLRNYLDPITCLLPQLETLELHLCLEEGSKTILPCELPKLRHLTISADSIHDSSILDLTQMITACPFLHKFTLKIEDDTYNNQGSITHQFPKISHQYLKVVEFIGSVGYPVDLQLASHLLETATMLEQFIVNPSCPFFMGRPYDFECEKDKQATRKRAEHLKKIIPQGVELVIM